MARIRMVTRTIESTTATCMCINPQTGTVSHNEYTISQSYVDPAIILKHVKKVYETETNIIVAVETSEVRETLYGMTEQQFMELAKVLPPRTNNSDETEDNEEVIDEPAPKKRKK